MSEDHYDGKTLGQNTNWQVWGSYKDCVGNKESGEAGQIAWGETF